MRVTPGRKGLLGVAAALFVIGLAGAVAVEGESEDVAAPAVTTTSAPNTSTTTTTTAPTTTTTGAPPPAPVPPNAVRPGTRVVVTPTGIAAPVVSVNDDGTVTVRTPCQQQAVVTGAKAVGPFTVVLDPGHGGSEPGAVGANKLSEKVLNLAVARQVEQALSAAGVSAVLTRSGDYRMTLTARADLVAAVKPKAFVSLHHNGESDGPRDGPGTEIFYQHQSADSRRLGGLIYEEVVRALAQFPGVAWQADRDAGVKTRINVRGGDYYAMLRQTAGTPSVLSEAAFLSNPPEAELLARPDVQKAEAEAIARGIVRYLTTKDAGSGYVEAYPRENPAGSGGGGKGCVDPPLQ